MSDELLDLAIATAGGQEHWDTLRGLNVDISIGGPIWARKGWPPDKTFDQILTPDTVKEHIVFTPFTRPDQRMVFDAAADSVTMQTLDGGPVEILTPARAGFKGMLRNSAWDALHLGYFLGYACWNYFTTRSRRGGCSLPVPSVRGSRRSSRRGRSASRACPRDQPSRASGRRPRSGAASA
ncbi:hypothetical protein P6B95_41210 [Streptomyces atratus]|uniref:hypothetical protein n=1 Tax=Streptomyces atratus TaxID=1893 RepID=UPI0016702708|nr:hypothetical protein [Streptomyces atratus]WPW33147.1 hypothetical protein P6B95_41210 [Streptomyces atratus]GGT52824.1 hypothetical protein GCM10010207_61170 [Streptomyces atratus]